MVLSAIAFVGCQKALIQLNLRIGADDGAKLSHGYFVMALVPATVLEFGQRAWMALRIWPWDVMHFLASVRHKLCFSAISGSSRLHACGSLYTRSSGLCADDSRNWRPCAITREVNNFDPHFMYPYGQTPLKEHDLIERIGDTPAVYWPRCSAS